MVCNVQGEELSKHVTQYNQCQTFNIMNLQHSLPTIGHMLSAFWGCTGSYVSRGLTIVTSAQCYMYKL